MGAIPAEGVASSGHCLERSVLDVWPQVSNGKEGLSMKTIFIFLAMTVVLTACEPAEVTRGREHYENLCALCHGLDGEGYLSESKCGHQSGFSGHGDRRFLKVAIERGVPKQRWAPTEKSG